MVEAKKGSSKTKTTSLRARSTPLSAGSAKQSLKDSGGAKLPRMTVKGKDGLTAPVYSLLGKTAGSLELPKEIFGVKVNEGLIAQAMRVYLNNRKGHNSNTKTRGEVTGSTRKIYAQKGTGRARHGGITAPIFVGGGIALGPKYRKTILDLPQKMKNASLISALSSKALSGEILGLVGIDKASGKTKEMIELVTRVKSLESSEKQKLSMLIVGDKNYEGVQRGVRNIEGVHFLNADQINVFEVIRHQSLVLTKEAVEKLQSRFAKKESKGSFLHHPERSEQAPVGSHSSEGSQDSNKIATLDARNDKKVVRNESSKTRLLSNNDKKKVSGRVIKA